MGPGTLGEYVSEQMAFLGSCKAWFGRHLSGISLDRWSQCSCWGVWGRLGGARAEVSGNRDTGSAAAAWRCERGQVTSPLPPSVSFLLIKGVTIHKALGRMPAWYKGSAT